MSCVTAPDRAALWVHGMDGAEAARDWPALTVQELVPVLSAYPDLGRPRAVMWHSPRPFAASGTVETERGAVFVKRHDARVRGVADLAEEHAFLAHLHAAGAKVPRVLVAADGATALGVGARTYELHDIADGEDLYRNDASWTPMRSLEQAEQAGAALRGLHEAACGFDAPPRRGHILVADCRLVVAGDLVAAIAKRAGACPALAAALVQRPWRRDVERVLLPWHAAGHLRFGAGDALWTHNDFHASNLLWRRDGGVAAILDFGLCNRTCAAFDLATAIERNAVEWLRLGDGDAAIGQPALACALLRGYGAGAALTREVACWLPLVHVDFALSELAYFHGITQSMANAERAYSDFLLGHAAWFATHHGRKFLDALA